MKRKNIGKVWQRICSLSLAIAIVIVGLSLNAVDVSAGSSDIIIDKSTFKEELDATVWNNPSADLIVKDEKIIFSKDSTSETRLITANPIKASEYHNEFLNAEYTLKVKTLPKGEKFIVALGLTTLESYYAEAGNLELVFENNGGLKAGLIAYDEDGAEKQLVTAKGIGASFGQDVNIKISVTTDMKVAIRINNTMFFDKKVPMDLEGRVGFLQTGKCEAEISDIFIVSHAYDTPENINISENFEKGSFNVNAMTSEMLNSCGFYPSAIAVQEYNGNQVLMFSNAGVGYFGTVYQYSNFELTFDVPYILYKNELREDGTIQKPANTGIVVGIADETADYKATGYSTSADAIVFNADSLYNLKGTQVPVSFADKNFSNKEKNEGYSIKLSVIDTVVTISMKALKDAKYQEIYSYKIGNATPTGYVHIWSMGQANFAIDNFTIVNKDKKGKTIDVDYQSGKMTGTEDYVYEPAEDVYLEVDTQSGFNWTMLIVYAAIAGAVVYGICLIVAKGKKTPKKKEVKADEV